MDTEDIKRMLDRKINDVQYVIKYTKTSQKKINNITKRLKNLKDELISVIEYDAILKSQLDDLEDYDSCSEKQQVDMIMKNISVTLEKLRIDLANVIRKL